MKSSYKNLLRLVSKKFEQLMFLNYQRNNVLVYPSALKLEAVVVENFELKKEDLETVINTAKILNEKIKYHPHAMACPPPPRRKISRSQ